MKTIAMKFQNSIRVLFLMICAIHLSECDYPYDDEYDDDSHHSIHDSLYDKQNKKEPPKTGGTTTTTGTGGNPQAPKDFFIPKLSFVPYSKLSSASIRGQENQRPPQPKKEKKKGKKKAPCKHGENGAHDGPSGDNYEGQGEDGEHSDDFDYDRGEHKPRTKRGRPGIMRTHTITTDSGESFKPKYREVINKYTIDVLSDSDKY